MTRRELVRRLELECRDVDEGGRQLHFNLMERDMKRKCEIVVSKLTHCCYISFGCTRRTNEYKTFAGAVRGAKRLGFRVLTKVDPMIEFVRNEKKTKVVTNLLSGKLVRIPVNTPACSDPSTETYWSM